MKSVKILIMIILASCLSADTAAGGERVRTTTVTFYVAPVNLESKIAMLRHFAPGAGGYVSYFSEKLVILRLPDTSMNELKSVLGQGAYILDQRVRHRDVTLKLIDLRARLATKEKLRGELMALFKGSEFHQTIEIERELGKVVIELENLRGRIRYYKENAALNDVRIYLQGRRGRHYMLAPSYSWMRRLGVEDMIRRWNSK